MVHGDNDKDCGGDGSGYGDYSGDNNDGCSDDEDGMMVTIV